MLRWRKRIRKMTYLAIDILSILGAFVCTGLYFSGYQGRSVGLSDLELVAVVLLMILFLITGFLIFDIYGITVEKQGRVCLKTAIKMAICLAVTDLMIGSAFYYMKMYLSRGFLLEVNLFIVLLMTLNRIVLKYLTFRDVHTSKSARNILVIGQSERGFAYIEQIRKHNYLNLNLVGYVSIRKVGCYKDVNHIGTLDDLPNILANYVIDEVAVARPLSYDPRLDAVLMDCQDRGITVTMLLDIRTQDTTKAHVAMVGDLPVLKFHMVSLNESQIFAKRILDIIGSLAGMVLFGIAFLIVGPMIKMETPGPVIFKQDRVGRNGRIFKVWKFRSMGVDAERQKAALMANNEMSGHMFKMTNDPRITRIGAFIRKTSIDELPQFYNVLKGDMSLVGTRPPTVNEVKEYENHHHKRISITPGITGNWQVSGRSEIEDFEEVVRLDAEYIQNWSVWLDIKILLKTVLVVFQKRGSK